MRHRVAGYRLNKSSAHRTALRRNLMTELFRHGRIRTTKAKAAAVRGDAERLITLAKRGNGKAAEEGGSDQHERKRAAAVLRDSDVVKVLFDEIAPRFAERPGGYTRVLKLGPRKGDSAEMVYLELVD